MEAVMPGLRTTAVEDLLGDILTPKRFSSGSSVICDCCRQRRPAGEFDVDGCGICIGCLESDVLLVELKGSLSKVREDHPLQQNRPVVTRGRT